MVTSGGNISGLALEGSHAHFFWKHTSSKSGLNISYWVNPLGGGGRGGSKAQILVATCEGHQWWWWKQDPILVGTLRGGYWD